MTRTALLAPLLACLLLAGTGCSRSPRVTFYTLEPVAAAAPAAPAPATTGGGARGASAVPGGEGQGRQLQQGAAGAPAPSGGAGFAGSSAAAAAAFSVSVGPVSLVESVDRPQLVVRVAENEVEVLESRRWAEPLRSALPRVIARDLGSLLGSERVSSYLEHASAHAEYRVVLDFERFEAAPGDSVLVEAAWTVRHRGEESRRTGRSRVQEPVRGPGYDAILAAYGRALSSVSRDLAAALLAERAAGAAAPPPAPPAAPPSAPAPASPSAPAPAPPSVPAPAPEHKHP